MKALVVEDEFVARRVLQRFLASYGTCDVAVDGEEALEAVQSAVAEGQPYELVCVDIGLPKLDGQDLLAQLRGLEIERGVELGQGAKIIMTTSATSKGHVLGAFRAGAEAYLIKPITLQALSAELTKLGLIHGEASRG